MNGPTHIWSRPVVGYYPGKEGSARDVLGKGRIRLPKHMIFQKSSEGWDITPVKRDLQGMYYQGRAWDIIMLFLRLMLQNN